MSSAFTTTRNGLLMMNSQFSTHIVISKCSQPVFFSREFLHYLRYAIDFSPIFYVTEAEVNQANHDWDLADDEGDLDTHFVSQYPEEQFKICCGWKSKNARNSSSGKVEKTKHLSNKIVAFILAKVENNIFNICKKKRECNAHITNIVVLQRFRRQGIAKCLLLELQERLMNHSNVKVLSLNVRENNVAAIQLYQSLHYKMVYKLPNYYRNGDHAHRMELQFCYET